MNEEDYIATHIDAEPEVLRRLYRDTHLHRLYPRMCTDHLQGRLLVMLTKMIRPQHILELGTFTGYSTLCFAEGMPKGCTIDTVEIDDDYSDDLRALFSHAAPLCDITLHIGDAEKIVPELIEKRNYDLVFIDANKRRYPQYYHALIEKLPAGAIILADNTLWTEKVLNDDSHDAQTNGIRQFNEIVANDNRVEKVILHIRDGLTIIRKK
ncbi:MAG: O-methyltransferase [Muribaculaceae bacterium]|nr:O-methyltransferase [Muribaculaceae bacterium]